MGRTCPAPSASFSCHICRRSLHHNIFKLGAGVAKRGKQHLLPVIDEFRWGNMQDVRQGKANMRECRNGAVKQSGAGIPSFMNEQQSGEGWFMLQVECKDTNLTETEIKVR